MKYKAFISYRHCEPDSAAAEKIIKVVESYGIPKTIMEKHHIDKRIGKLFRDADELAAADDLSVAITEALDDSEYLIMICSPRYIESEWCMLEVQHWINRNGRKNIIAVLLEGEPADSFPRILTDYEENGKQIHTEPLAVDIRGADKKEILKNIDVQKFRILSSLIGCNYDDLRQRQQERARKNMAAAFTSAFAVLSVIIAVILGANFKLSEQNELIAEQYSELEEKNDEIVEANDVLEQKNDELNEANRSILSANAETLDMLAEANGYLGNNISAAEAELEAYKLAEEAGADSDKYFRNLFNYIDVYSVKPAEKVKKQPLEIKSSADPSDISIIGNNSYFMIKNRDTIYCYSVFDDDILYYKELDSGSLKRIIMLDGSRFAAFYGGSRKNDAGDTEFYYIVKVIDFISEEEFTYEGIGTFTDAVFSDGMIRVLISCPYKLISFDEQCNIIESYDTDSFSKQILDPDTILTFNSIQNVKTGEIIQAETNGYYSSFSSSSEFKMDWDEDKYVYNEERAYRAKQYSYAVWTNGSLFYNTYVSDEHNIVNGINGETIFEEDFEGCLRFAGNAEKSVIAYTDKENKIIISKIEDSGLTSLTVDNDMPVRKLVMSDNMLIAVFYEKEPEIYFFDSSDGFRLIAAQKFEEMYIDAYISGNVCYMFSVEEAKVDVFLLNDFSEKNNFTFTFEQSDNYYSLMAASIVDSKAFLIENGPEVPPNYVFVNFIDGTVSGIFTPDKNYLNYDEDGSINRFGLYSDNNTLFSSYSSDPLYGKSKWFLPEYKEIFMNNENPNDKIVYLEEGETIRNYNDKSIFTSVYHGEGKKGYKRYDRATGEAENIELSDPEVYVFCTNGSIRAECNFKDIKIYDGTELIDTITAQNGSDGLRLTAMNDPDIIAVYDNGFERFYSLSEQKELLQIELLKSEIRIEEKFTNGRNYILVNGQHLIDKDNWSVVHDFGLESVNSDIIDFYYNEHIGMWGVSGWNGNISDVTFFYPDTFEEAFTVSDVLALSPDGKNLYKLNWTANSVSSLVSEISYCRMPIYNKEEIIRMAEDMLSTFRN